VDVLTARRPAEGHVLLAWIEVFVADGAFALHFFARLLEALLEKPGTVAKKVFVDGEESLAVTCFELNNLTPKTNSKVRNVKDKLSSTPT
jgi:hypothetical protein